jgi:hypothetical protein
MTVHAYVIARWPGDSRPRVIPPALVHEAKEKAIAWGMVWAFTRSHALRLWMDGTEAVRGVDGRIERCGVER